VVDMPERKKIIHYCAKCCREMQYKDKKMLYLYDVIEKKYFASQFYTKKRLAINLCDKCAEEIEKIINDWKES